MTLALRVAPTGFSLSRKRGDARRESVDRLGWLVGLTDGDRLLGLGEASPLPGYSDETIDDARTALASFDARALDGMLERVAERRFEAVRAGEFALPASARAGLETALIDAVSVREGVPFHRMLSPSCAARLVPCQLVDSFDSRDARAIADDVVRGHAKAVKLKIGRDTRSELRLARELRTAIPPGVELRFDANRSLDAVRDVEFLHELASLMPCLLEEPLADPALAQALAAWPLALDESLRDLRRRGSPVGAHVAAIVLKPTTLGLLDAFALAHEWGGVRSIVSHTYEGPVGFAAAVGLALALGVEAPGLDGTYLPSGASLTCREAGGALVAHSHAGLGIDRERVIAEARWI